MPAFLLDADAVIHLHSLSLIDAVEAALRAGRIELHCTQYVWEHELVHLREVRERLVAAGLTVHQVGFGSPAGALFRQLLKERGNPGRSSRGEVQLVAFAAHAGFRLSLVAQDAGARALGGKHGIESLDLAGFLCELVLLEAVERGLVEQRLVVWENPGAGNGRPRGWDGFARYFDRWRHRHQP